MDEGSHSVVTLGLSSIQETKRQVAAAFRGHAQGTRIDFVSIDLLWKVLTVKRLEILQAMAGQGAMAVREVARRVGRDIKAVHGDVTALVSAGILDRTAAGKVRFPYDEVRVDFTLKAA